MSNSEEGPGRKYRKLEDGVRSLSSLPWNDALGKLLDSGHSGDVIFLVGPEGGRPEIRAHKLILSTKSEVFGVMVDKRWNNHSGDNVVRIEIGPEVNPRAFQKLIQFIYKEDAEGCLESLGFEDLFDLRDLSGMYGFAQLKEAAALKIALELVKDYTKCYFTLKNELEDKDLRDVAFTVLKWHLWLPLISDDLLTKWTEEIWENVLNDEAIFKKLDQDDSSFIEEIDLFKNLYRWRAHDPSTREEPFQKLVKLIRFPLMSPAQLLDEIRPTGILASDELLDILQSKQGSTVPAQQNPRVQLTAEKRKQIVLYATTSKEVNDFCKSKEEDEDGDNSDNEDEVHQDEKIMLLPGEYFGDMEVSEDHLNFNTTLTGFGPYTILQGRRCALKIASHVSTLENITIQSTMFILNVTGDDNVVKNVRTTCKNQMLGFEFGGNDNILENFRSQSLCPTNSSELEFKSDMNEFTGLCDSHEICSYDSPRFVVLHGRRNKVSNFNCTFVLKNPVPVIPRRYQTDFRITVGNNIENVNFDELLPIFDESSSPGLADFVPFPYMGARLLLDCAVNITIRRCCFAELQVTGQDHVLENVFVIGSTIIRGPGHKFTDCKFGEVADSSENKVKTDCVTVPEWIQIMKDNAQVYHNM